jgi:hypothetical protein
MGEFTPTEIVLQFFKAIIQLAKYEIPKISGGKAMLLKRRL